MRISELSIRQREVLNLLILGLTNKEIAVKLGISEKTVKVHRQQVMEKTGTMSLAELVVLSSKAGLC
jgi:DNA-binding CsgD family transcriptional regulator